jgi:hypothetical protein
MLISYHVKDLLRRIGLVTSFEAKEWIRAFSAPTLCLLAVLHVQHHHMLRVSPSLEYRFIQHFKWYASCMNEELFPVVIIHLRYRSLT